MIRNHHPCEGMIMGCSCEFSNVGHHEDKCELSIPLLKRLEAAKERVIKAADFDSASAIRDAIYFIRKERSPHPPEKRGTV